MDHKKLKLSEKKCFKMHVGKQNSNCPTLKVDGQKIKSVDTEKYFD